MNAMKSLFLAAALTAAGLTATVDAQANPAARGGWSGGGHGGGNWSGHRGPWGGQRYWGPRVGFYIGAPILFGPWYWGYPYDYYYPRGVVVERVIERYPQSYPDGVMDSAPTTEVPRTPGAPSQAPAYMNFCESAKAYYPKVTSCPEGWKFVPSR